ncbi:MAG: hypothetical protein R3F14_14400 [Polyangiaceae bacterium]
MKQATSHWSRALVLGWTLAISALFAGCGPETDGAGGGGAGGTTGTGGAPISCTKTTDCPETGSECVERFCDAGTCGTKELPNGSDAPTQTPGDCAKEICAGGEVITVEDSSDLPVDDGSDCTIEACSLGMPLVTNAAAGAACQGIGTTVCDGEGECVQCLTDGDCAAAEICDELHQCVPNTCRDGMLNGGETDIDCGGPCLATCEKGESCAAETDCATGFCADGVCCDSACDGECTACAGEKTGAADGTCANVKAGTDPDDECTPEPGDECGNTDGLCSGKGSCNAAPAGTACTGGAGLLSECDGAGECKAKKGQACGDGGECVTGFCVDGVCCDTACGALCQACSNAKKGNGADGTCASIAAGGEPDDECVGLTACSNGQCVLLAAGQACDQAGECQSGFCTDGVCCNNACAGGCEACSAAKKGSGANGSCGPILAGTDPDDECAGAAVCTGNGACKLPNGLTCTMDAECGSGFCTDGVCCNAACGGTCQACTAALKGTGADGTCGNILNGQDPQNECGGATVCNGAGACALLPIGSACTMDSECQSVVCKDGFCCNNACTDACSACSSALKGSGTNGTCGPIASGTDPENECAGVLVCNGSGTCKAPNGASCAVAADCLSNQCADGVCCNSACNTLCQACTAAKKGSGNDGTCGPIASGADPDNECVGGASCNGSGACALVALGGVCTINAECVSNQCVDGVCCNTACTGLCQACTAAKKGSGADGTCGAVGVGTDPDNECPGATTCNGAACTQLPNGSPCSVNGECQSNQCVDGVCCNNACTGVCQACSAAKKGSGSDGTCGPIAAGSDPDGECAAGTTCSGGGVCQ